MTRTPAALLLCALAFAACGSDGDKPESAAAKAPPAAAKATPFPAVTDGFLTAGETYATTKFRPSIAITPSEGEWKAGLEDGPAHFALRRDSGEAGEALLAFHRMEQVFDGEKGGKVAGDAGPPPDDFGEWLLAHPHLKVSGPEATQALGRPAKQYDVSVRSFPKATPDECGKADGCVPMFMDSRDLVWYSKDVRARFVVLDDPAGKELVVELYSGLADRYDEVLAQLQPTLDSAKFAAG
jgi:hypothetical protein